VGLNSRNAALPANQNVMVSAYSLSSQSVFCCKFVMTMMLPMTRKCHKRAENKCGLHHGQQQEMARACAAISASNAAAQQLLQQAMGTQMPFMTEL
jgi:DNA polymerase III psi subunit